MKSNNSKLISKDMESNNKSEKAISRRKFLGNSAALAALSVVPVGAFGNGSGLFIPPAKKETGSKFGGVQIGAITYSWRSMPGGVDNIIKYCTAAGLSSIELMSGDVEDYLGAPKNPNAMGGGAPRPPRPPVGEAAPAAANAPAGAPPAAPAGPPQRRQQTPEQQAAAAKYAADLKAWRLSVPMSKYEDVRKKFEAAGIKIHIVKFSPSRWSDEEIDYAFKAAKALGTKGVTDEISEDAVKKLAPFAEKHGMWAIFHQHMQFATPGFSYDPFLAVSPAVMMNFDTGHFFGSTGIHPNTIIEKYHDRIASMHIKDKTGPKTDPPNMNQVWGQGESPLSDILLLMKEKKWDIPLDVELEYEIKPWSTAVNETRLCVQYARNILI
jgi:sugar phosphate isomerase/epimerase